MTDPTQTTYIRTARDMNGAALRVGDQAALLREGHYVVGQITNITDHTGLGDIVTMVARSGERISCCADVLARSRRETKRRAA